ncbi:GyrI-like domain-containing protein [Paenibacillus glycinis]|uniref:GyrI-like small molecule binding domain-containing protein n=1 Tax=Paenibacillus glycinis TaxID=2697035 RepID=A0ABW9XL00_9BACL|nr:GyrI-like domain-containing protein [Paenibacillus glycinis]NBD23305.1 hypothetical protein [Paenibacillus glycinis]
MSLQWRIVDEPFTVTLHGVAKPRLGDEPYGDIVMELLGRVWTEVRDQALPHRGVNHVFYGPDDVVFAGVELESAQLGDRVISQLTRRTLTLNEYAYCVHRGSYAGLGRTYDELCAAVSASGRECRKPLLEVYGHWNEDESLLETEIYFALD